MLSTIDEDTVFPHDRLSPQEMINFRLNGKYKNKIPNGSDANEKIVVKTEPITDSDFISPNYDIMDEQPIVLTGVGVAEPVLDTELGTCVQ